MIGEVIVSEIFRQKNTSLRTKRSPMLREVSRYLNIKLFYKLKDYLWLERYPDIQTKTILETKRLPLVGEASRIFRQKKTIFKTKRLPLVEEVSWIF